MAFWEEFKASVSTTVNKAAKKTEDIADITKKKINLKAEEDKLDTLYAQLGKLRYTELRRGEDKSETVDTLLCEIDESKQRIHLLREAISKARGEKLCVACGATIAKEDVFCSKCGENQNK